MLRSLVLIFLLLIISNITRGVVNYGYILDNPEELSFIVTYDMLQEIIVENGIGSGYVGGYWYFEDSNFSKEIELGQNLYFWAIAEGKWYMDKDKAMSIPNYWGETLLIGLITQIPRLNITISNNVVTLYWDYIYDKSLIYRIEGVYTGVFSYIGCTNKRIFSDTTIKPQKSYYYTVVPKYRQAYIGHTNIVVADIPLYVKQSKKNSYMPKAIIWGELKK